MSLREQYKAYFYKLGIRVQCTGVDEVTAVKKDGTRKVFKIPTDVSLFDELIKFAKQ